ncbi:integral membrane sensor signal transduction histidine kinase : Histidine kinase OS=Singulisphaera acidiphila (strain ATCC BAA-1392 / DSM 18658 / VKM B-2454 / MOB10) GN=Sinac_3191 PE=4 SV=1: HAMP: HisKA: HATPase_c [Gemmata massiliana]|uniref:histidine kinase n=1 Tax=Gemmata massiliana TaxID=1210884 RepID=A0A6P2D340_9BACT|nr:HAMP domain-containing sensor histidine kinase [Gemmata massiliana]VTR93820.1 integral membrane sensor signal transduction histidine kinase : Histidine kinase OS=Singulisphaera acidiphila (strain ATCC BAA-1392 / DSM 18658 / VKM B-2454 / MOB10) GN=Sinac_3191 PE=4 SV=1: HAMP: HisKA: HATPase_c [Gemmata massiliana]
MARRRLRHKLMLGLVLVAGSIGLLASGTAYGLYTYYISVKTIDRKVNELGIVTQMIGALNTFDQGDPDKADGCLLAIGSTQGFLNGTPHGFDFANKKNVQAGYDPDDGAQEAFLVPELNKNLDALQKEVNDATKSSYNGDKSLKIRENPRVRAEYENARRTAENLRHALLDDIQKSGQESFAAIRRAVWIVGFAMVWALALVATMLYYFRVWMFAPIRELQAGVQRVHHGTFDQPLVLNSGDELQELADEFNAMVARLHAVYADLARQVNERSRQLVRSERMVSVGFLAAGVAHEINNPLASILFCSEALERRLQDVLASSTAPPAETEVLTRYLKMVQQEALRCKDITQKLLDFSRTGERTKDPADLTGLIRGVLEVARHLPSSRGKEVIFEPTGYIVAPVNAQDLKSVILNLVVNALDSMEDGGQLGITLGTAGGYAELVFVDTGCGMAPDVLQNIFEPFFTKSRTGKGTGLGLFISHQIVDQHGGTITAASAGPGTGSTFTVRIPLQIAPGVTDAPGTEGEPEPAPTVLTFPGSRTAA